MSLINQHNASEYLTLYMDGELDSSLISEFENELASNLELQSEYKELLAIRGAIQSNVKRLIPPYESTTAIFESLGLSYTTSLTSTTTIATSVWQQLLIPIVASFSAALVTIGAFVGIDIDNHKPTTNSMVNSILSVERAIESISENNSINNNSNSTNITTTSKNDLSINKPTSTIKVNSINKSTNIITRSKSSNYNLKFNNNNIVIEDKSQEGEFIPLRTKSKYENIEFFGLNNSNIIAKFIPMFNIGQESKFNYSYNKQNFERFGSDFNRNSIILSLNQSGARISYDRIIIGESAITDIITGFSINAGTNLFNRTFALNNLYASGDLKLINLQISNLAQITPIVGAGYDITAKSLFFRVGGEIDLPSISNFNIALRTEYNSLIGNTSIYNQSNNFNILFLIKYNF